MIFNLFVKLKIITDDNRIENRASSLMLLIVNVQEGTGFFMDFSEDTWSVHRYMTDFLIVLLS